MILTCPECATSYFVDDSRIPAGGRSVKCTSCGARWTATRDAQIEDVAEPVAAADPEPQVEAVDAVEPDANEDATAPLDDLEVTGPEVAAPPEDTGLRVRPASRPAAVKPAKKEANAKAALWAGMAVAVAALIGGAILFRTEIVRLWPASSKAFAGIGLPVNEVGLVIEKVKFEPTLQGGRPVLSVTGAVRNVTKEAAASPPIRFSLLDKAGNPVAAKVARPIEARVPPGATRYFAISIQDPPSTATSLDVAFEVGKPEASHGAAHAEPAAAAHAAEAPTAHEPAPVEAQPLPHGSPDALPEHG